MEDEGQNSSVYQLRGAVMCSLAHMMFEMNLPGKFDGCSINCTITSLADSMMVIKKLNFIS